ncbi:MAG: trigger factor [Cyanobacteria bacterium REEB459]|nr:trigger factor [Cyanobacteria bacterium REEB459]
MKVTQEVLPDSQVGLEIEIPPELSQKTYDRVLSKLMNTTTIPGFRKGKVPKPVFLQRIGATQFKAAVLEELLQTAIDQAIQQEAIEALGNYQLTSSFEELVSQYQPNQSLIVKATVDVPPRVTLKQYKGLTIEAEEVLPDLDQVEQTLTNYQNKRATLVPVEERPAQMGDVVVVDFVGKLKKAAGELEEFEGGSGSDYTIELETGRFIPGFVEGIVGMALAERKDLDIAFPEDYGQPNLAGQSVVFSITMKEIKEKELPDLDDDFAQDVSEFETLEDLRQSLVDRYTQQAENATRSNQEAALLKVLVDHLEAEIPETLIQQEVDFILRQTLMQLSQQGLDLKKMMTQDLVNSMRQQARPDALARLRSTLALGEVAKQENLTVLEADLQARFDQAMAEEDSDDTIDPERLKQFLEEELLQQTIFDWLFEANRMELVPAGTLASSQAETSSPGLEAITLDADVTTLAPSSAEEE